MFEIEIVVGRCEMSGLEALDWRRTHNMFDGVKAVIDTYRKKFRVDEAFARRWFTPSEVCPSVVVYPKDLLACDVKPHKKYDWVVHVDLNAERAKALFVEARRAKASEEFDDVVDFKTRRPKPWDYHDGGSWFGRPTLITAPDVDRTPPLLERGGRA